MQTFVIVITWIVWGRTNSCQRSVCQSWLLSWWFLLNPSLLLIPISLGYQSACFGCVLFAHTLLGRLVKDRHVRGIRIGDEVIDRSYHFVLSVVYRKSQSQHAMFILSVRTGGTPPHVSSLHKEWSGKKIQNVLLKSQCLLHVLYTCCLIYQYLLYTFVTILSSVISLRCVLHPSKAKKLYLSHILTR